MQQNITWVGMDAHKKFISVAVLKGNERMCLEWQIENSEQSVKKLMRKLLKLADGWEVRACYEAGPCGFVLKRQMEQSGEIICEVIAPSLIPQKTGSRVKTDKKDARKLAELLRAGLLTEVVPPTAEEESVRDLCRCREALKVDRLRARHRLKKFLLRRGVFFTQGRASWSVSYMKWVRGLQFDRPADRITYTEYLGQVEYLDMRLKALEVEIGTIAQTAPYQRRVGILRCFKGIDTLTAMVILTELFDFRRFQSPRQLMSYVGLVTSEYTSGGIQSRGGITKTGNRRLRTALVEAAWHYRHRYKLSKVLAKRREGQPPAAIHIADKAGIRLSNRYYRLTARGKEPNKAIAAVARELVAFLWSAINEVENLA